MEMEYPHRVALVKAYWDAIDDQRKQRGLLPLESGAYEARVAQAIYQAGLLALRDNIEDTPRYRVVAAPTGTGKSTFSFALIKAYIETDPDASVLFLVETAKQADASYVELSSLVGEGNVAVWTGAHDIEANEEDVISDFDFLPDESHRFSLDDLESFKVAIATHAFYRSTKRAEKARLYAGNRRRLTFVDERPDDVRVYDIGIGDIANARDEVAKKMGADCTAAQHLMALQNDLEDIWKSETSKTLRFDSVSAMGHDWFNTEAARRDEGIAAANDRLDCVRKVFSFARALAQGFSFSSRFNSETEEQADREDKGITGARFVGYGLEMPLLSGTVLLDATASLDGMDHILNNREEVRVSPLSFKNLDIRCLHNELPQGKTVAAVLDDSKLAQQYAEFIKQTILANADNGETVLAVVHKKLIKRSYLVAGDNKDKDTLSDPATGKTVFIEYLTWGTGIGSNAYKHCTSVFTFSEFYVPVKKFAAVGMGSQDLPATRENLTPYQKVNNNRKSGPYFEQKEGHLRRWFVQLVMRGSARNITPDGTCGKQRLFVVHETLDRFLRNKTIMFGDDAPLSMPQPKPRRKAEKAGEKPVGGVSGMLALLCNHPSEVIDIRNIREMTGIDFNKHGRRYLANPIIASAMASRGWRFEPGTSRTNLSKFVRS